MSPNLPEKMREFTQIKNCSINLHLSEKFNLCPPPKHTFPGRRNGQGDGRAFPARNEIFCEIIADAISFWNDAGLIIKNETLFSKAKFQSKFMKRIMCSMVKFSDNSGTQMFRRKLSTLKIFFIENPKS